MFSNIRSNFNTLIISGIMAIELNKLEVRVLGSLVEKQLTTPEYYPLTLNALTAACNQKSNREPVMSLGETDILAATDSLRDKNLVYLFYGSTSRTVKYKHMLPNVFDLDAASVAVMALLLLRGPQTVGELRGRSDRLYEFSGLDEIQQTLDELSQISEPLVLKLERQPGQKESRYAHLLSGEIDQTIIAAESVTSRSGGSVANERIEKLEIDVESVRTELEQIRHEFAEFRKQFE